MTLMVGVGECVMYWIGNWWQRMELNDKLMDGFCPSLPMNSLT